MRASLNSALGGRERKNLTHSERALLQSIAAEPEDVEPDTRMVVRNLSELCEI